MLYYYYTRGALGILGRKKGDGRLGVKIIVRMFVLMTNSFTCYDSSLLWVMVIEETTANLAKSLNSSLLGRYRKWRGYMRLGELEFQKTIVGNATGRLIVQSIETAPVCLYWFSIGHLSYVISYTMLLMSNTINLYMEAVFPQCTW